MVQSRKNANSGYWAYANNFTYNAAGAVTSMQLGNGAWESTVFNSRLQPTQIALGTTQGGTGLLDLDYTYGGANNNGNVLTQTITVPTVGTNTGFAAVQTYSYDSLNRLKDATEMLTPNGGSATETWKQTFLFDRYGNRTFDTTLNRTTTIPPGCPTAVCNPSANPSDNKLKASDGYVFDNSGNTTTDAESRTFIYDAENKQTEVRDASSNVIGQYFYDGDGKRVKKYVPGTGEATIFVHDAGGKLVAEYSTIVEPIETAKVAYLTNDHLGSPRINTDRDGNVTARHDYHPFGEEIATSQRTASLGYADDTIRKQFTSYERDNESNLDFAEARYYKPAHGRFTSTDPIIMSFKRAIDPQRINLYAYSRNNPLRYIDPDGEDIVEPTGLSKEDQEAYEKWKAAYLATEAGRKTWERYQNDKNFTLKIVVGDRGSDDKNRSAEVKNFVFDADGNFTGATMELGRNLGKGLPGDSSRYPILSALNTENSGDIGASKIAHEFGHLNDFRSMGKLFYEQQQILNQINARHDDLTSRKATPVERGNDPTLKQLNQKFQTQFGLSPEQNSVNRDRRADRDAIPTIRQIFGRKKLTGEEGLLKEKL